MKTENEIYEAQDLIDDFMGREHWIMHPNHEHRGYHNDWNMLMNVVEKILKTYTPLTGGWPYTYTEIEQTKIGTPIKIVHQRVVAFIRWYNENKKP